MIVRHILTHGLLFGFVSVGYLFVIMRTISPRVWGYADYPEALKSKVPPQTKRERRLALLIGIPWMVFVLGFPIVSTLLLKSKLNNEISFWTAFLNLLVLAMLVNFGDWLILDWAIVSKITPHYVIIPGTEASDYKDFSHHFKGQARATVVLVVLALFVAAIVASA